MSAAFNAIVSGKLPEREVILVHDSVATLRWHVVTANGATQLTCEIRALALGSASPLSHALPMSLPDNVEAILTMMTIHENQMIFEANAKITGLTKPTQRP
jgi:hypothetical protein